MPKAPGMAPRDSRLIRAALATAQEIEKFANDLLQDDQPDAWTLLLAVEIAFSPMDAMLSRTEIPEADLSRAGSGIDDEAELTAEWGSAEYDNHDRTWEAACNVISGHPACPRAQ